ncbi:MAG: indolepyruvate ferredoxin oxidoreductase family protein [Actinomycetia bacterium]|nr:indolepyruvate ferredoxin oxidoreductase family protein [Actinomycetes bacterium]
MTDLAPAPFDLDAKYTEEYGSFFYTGIHALVRVPIDQMLADKRDGLRTAAFISGYQGSPLGGFDKELISHKALMAELNIIHKAGLNEELGATAVMGSQVSHTFPDQKFDGVLGIWYGKAPGLDRAGDAIRHAQYAGTGQYGGALALTGDDPANKSSTLPSASEFTIADLHMPIIHPGNVQEVLDLGRHAIHLSRTCGLWTSVKVVTSVADGSGTAEVGADRVKALVPEWEWKGQPYRPRANGRLGGAAANTIEEEIHDARLPLARQYGQDNYLNRVTINPHDAWLGIMASGRVYHEILEAANVLGLDEKGLAANGIRVLQMSMPFPFDNELVRRFAQGLDEIMVVEEKRPFMEGLTREALYGASHQPRITGKHEPDGKVLVRTHGSLDADALIAPLERRLLTKLDASRLKPQTASEPIQITTKKLVNVLPARTPYYCSGCPHSTGTKAPEDALVGGGIGCHGLVGLMAPERVGKIMGNTQMGGEGVHWIGIEPFVDVEHFIQNLGDGTFAHSGSLAIRAGVAAGSHITFKVLYNGAVAMTGGQDAPGAMTVPNLAAAMLAESVGRVIVTTDEVDKYKDIKMPDGVEVWDRTRIIEAQEKLAEEPGVTVLIHDQACAAEKRRDRKRGLVPDPPERIVINERVCEGCGDCGVQSNCLSVQPIDTEFGRKTQIHQSSCNKDYSCLAGDCPSFLTVIPNQATGRASRDKGGARRRPELDQASLTEPTMLVPTDDFTIRMPGVGGTGVVTMSQILGTAATLDGKYVGGLDQTGLSQKAGPVVSDLRITNEPLESTNKLTAGSADLYLVFDLLVGLAPQNLDGVAPDRTVAITSMAKTPTGEMVRDVHAPFPDLEPLKADLDAVTRAEHNRYFDAIALTEGLFGESTTANTFQVGVAYQTGTLPISAQSLEEAIRANGAAVEANLAAFRWGRQWAIDPQKVRDASVLPEDHLPKLSDKLAMAIDKAGIGQGELGRLVRMRAADLAEYQDDKYARKYLQTVQTAASSGYADFAEGVARYAYKLMAYKDEYEVARLHLEEAAKLTVSNAVGDDVTIKYNLHPPMLRALGLDEKVVAGPWIEPGLKALKRGKRLRGTPADPFGRAKVRRVERALVGEYRDLIEQLAPKVTDDNVELATELANLPDMVRGYEQIKLANVERYQADLGAMRSQLGV